MPNQTINENAAALQGNTPKSAKDMPHGLLVPPPEVRAALERERTRHLPEVFARAEAQMLSAWTIGFYFEPFPYEVLYRQTPEGPEVLAVGFDEVFARTDGMRPEKMEGLHIWSP